MSSVPKRRLTPAEYLAIERKAEFKSAYFNGEMFAMADTSRWHVRASINLSTEIVRQLRDSPCEVYNSDMRVKISPTGLYTYPDLSIVCDGPRFEDDVLDTLLNPRVIFEVLSKSTEAYDRGRKFGQYRQIVSLREFVLVSQTEPLIERYLRQADGDWLLSEFKGLEAVLVLESVPCRVPLAEIYRNVDFAESSSEPESA